jgi:pyruvate dehydrogenase E1 component beta subunit
VRRLGGPRIPVGYAPVLEAQARIGQAQVVDAVQACLQSKSARAA